MKDEWVTMKQAMKELAEAIKGWSAEDKKAVADQLREEGLNNLPK